MNLEGRNLSLHSRGNDVRLLHTELRKLGVHIPAEEYAQQSFGPVTHRAVQAFQSRYRLVVTGVVNEETARRINEAVDALGPVTAFSVQGQVRLRDQRPVAAVFVRAFDKDLRSEELLGEAVTDGQGHYEIQYTARQFRRVEKKNADLIVRVFNKEDALLGESDLLFTAREVEKVDLVVAFPPAIKLSEYEQLVRVLEPVLDDVPSAELTNEDMTFLLKELAGEPIMDQQRLQLLADGARLARETRLPAEFFYGLAHQLQIKPPLILESFLALKKSACRDALLNAIRQSLIPAGLQDSVDAMLGRWEQLKLERKVLVERHLTGCLVNEETGKRLAGYLVQAAHRHGDEQLKELGVDITDRQGQFSFSIVTLPSLPPGQPDRPIDRLNLRILTAKNEEIHRAEFEIKSDQAELPDVKVPQHSLPKPPVRLIREVAASLRLELPEKLTSFLAERKIASIQDIRGAGGLHRLEHFPISTAHPTVKALEAQANLSVLTTSVEENALLIEKGFHTLSAIAAVLRNNFIAAVGKQLGEGKAVQVHAAARAQRQALNTVLAGIGADIANRQTPMIWQAEVGEEVNYEKDPVAQEVGELFIGSCACPDCEAAVSPTAYLADLLDYTVEHVKRQSGAEEFITLEHLANLLHQPFGDLPSSCKSVTTQVRQVRLCVEVLRHYLGDPLPNADEMAYRFAAYATLLTKLGTSHEELRLSRSAATDVRQALAQRLGIDLSIERPDELDTLLFESSSLTEASLEQLFGLVDTTRDPLSNGITRGDTSRQILRWRLTGIEWGWNTDHKGIIYARLSHPSGSVYRVDLYRDSAREQHVATGDISSPRGVIQLSPRNHSDLSGVIDIDFSRESDDIELVAVAEFLSWRLQHLRTQWKTQDAIADPYTETPISPYTESDLLPVIDPDLIGPDDFRTPFQKTRDTDPDGPFDLWIQRRNWIDAQIHTLQKRQQRLSEEMRSDAEVLTAILEELYPAVELRLPWPASHQSLTGVRRVFETLGENLAIGKDVKETERHIRSIAGLLPESFSRLREIQIKAQEQRRLSPEDWEDVFSILVQREKCLQFSAWREAERDLADDLFGPRYFWNSLREPIAGSWPPDVVGDRPLIDPEIIGLQDLPEATAGRRAIALWQKRQEELDVAFHNFKSRRETQGFNAMLESALGDVPSTSENWQSYLASLLERARRAEASDISEERTRVQHELATLHLTQEQLARLMEVQSQREIDRDEVYAILTTCWKQRTQWPAWRVDEHNDPILQGRYWLACKARLPKWRASVADRQAWRQALQLRSHAPIIDLDLIGSDYLRNMTSGPVYTLWRGRHAWIRDQLSDLRRKREAEATPAAGFDKLQIESLVEPGTAEALEAQYQAIREASGGVDDLIGQALGVSWADLGDLLADLDSSDMEVASEALRNITERLGFNVEAFRLFMRLTSGTVSESDESDWSQVYAILARATLTASIMILDQEQEQGKGITERLAQFGLTNAAFSYLVRMRKLLASGADLQDPEWNEVYSILLQVRKSRTFARWLDEEWEASITLSPEHFQIPEPLPLQFPPPEPDPLPAWRATERDLRQWRNTLEGRIEQEKTTIAALHEAIGAAEETTLPALRDALVMAADVEGSTLAIKAKRLTDVLLIDTQCSGCQQTTRISQAIETVQGFLWSLRTGQLQDTYEDLALLADNFDEEWTWIGSYATWRAAMFVFLYPENILLPSLRRDQTPSFRKLVADLRASRGLTTRDACIAAKEYAEYFENICTLSVEATCYGETRIHKDDPCGKLATPDKRNLFYMFAIGGKTGKVYWSALDPEDAVGYPQTFWEAVPGLEQVQVSKIVGSAPYHKTDEQRFIILFLLVQEDDATKLLLYKYNLEIAGKEGWSSGQPVELGLPTQNRIHSIRAVQSSFFQKPPTLALHLGFTDADYICLRSLNTDANGWEGEETNTESETGESEDDWSQYQVWGFSAGTLHAVIKSAPHGAVTWQAFGQRLDRILERSYVDDFGMRHNVYSEELRETYLSAPDLNGRPNTFSTSEGQRPGSPSFLGAFPISPSAWCIYFREEGGQFSQNAAGVWREDVERISRLRRIVPHYGPSLSTGTNCMVFHLSRLGVLDFSLLTYRWLENEITRLPVKAIHPKPPGHLGAGTTLFYISAHFSDAELQRRRRLIRRIFRENTGESSSIQAYLEEAYYFVPVHLALQLQRQGNYTAALDWFRTVYDYSAPTEQRKISYVLKREEELSLDYEREADWLLDPLNPHLIAANRRKTYTRFTLLALVRCFLEYADAEFALDTSESVPRARALYTTATELLDESSLQQRISSTCEELIAELSIEVGSEVEVAAWEYKPLWRAIVFGLSRINCAETLVDTIGAIKKELSTDQLWEMRLSRARDLIDETPPSAPKPLKTIVANRKEKSQRASELLLSRSWMTGIASQISNYVEKRLQNVMYMRGTASAETVEHEAGIGESSEASVNATGLYAYQPGLSFDFCIPPNPVLSVLRLKAELNLYKIRTCRNIVGMERQLDPYTAPTDTMSGLPQIGVGGQLVLPGTVTLQPTPYRYQVLIERAKQLVQMAAQFEAAMLAALEKRDAEYYQVLKANQDMQLTRQGLRLQELRVREAEDGVELAELQRDRAQILADTYAEWISADLNEHENNLIAVYEDAAKAKATVAAITAAMTSSEAFMEAGAISVKGYILAAAIAGLAVSKGIAETLAVAAEKTAQIEALLASHERRKDEWELQKKVAEQDIKVGEQQITLAEDHVRVVGQEHRIAEMQVDHAQEVVDFLANKFTNVELYDWMSGVLEGVYSFFLQQATAMAKLAENQVAFERQEIPPAYIQANYWKAPGDMALVTSPEGASPDRRGLTGSARLLQDLYQLDLYAFKTEQRKLQLTKTLSLAHLVPDAFERFRQTGVMTFALPIELFDRDFPGHYLRLIKRISVSVLALIPPTEGIHATLSTTGLSRVVIGSGGLFQRVDVRRYPESIALTSPIHATGLFELAPQNQEMLLPFEGLGVDTFWEFRLPKAANRFDYHTLADVLITIEYTALEDFAYRQQVIRELDDTVSGDRSFSIRHDLPDQWYSLHHPDQTDTPMVVRFETRRRDFPPNIDELRIQQIMLSFTRIEGATFEVPVSSLQFTEQAGAGPVGGAAMTNAGLISTRSGGAGSWLAIIGKPPIGEWELTLPSTAEMRSRFENGEVENILFILTYAGRTPQWP